MLISFAQNCLPTFYHSLKSGEDQKRKSLCDAIKEIGEEIDPQFLGRGNQGLIPIRALKYNLKVRKIRHGFHALLITSKHIEHKEQNIG